MVYEDRVLLARVARLNRALAAIATPLAHGVMDAEDGNRLGNELIAMGREFARRAYLPSDVGGMCAPVEASSLGVNGPRTLTAEG
jgi:hypothetical protein